MVDQGSIAGDIGPVARVMIDDQTSAVVFDGLAQLKVGRRSEILRAPGHRPTEPFNNGSMTFAASQLSNDLGPPVVIFQGAHDLFDPVVLCFQAVILLFKRLVLPLQAMDLADHVLFCRLDVNLIMTCIGKTAGGTPLACWPRPIALAQ